MKRNELITRSHIGEVCQGNAAQTNGYTFRFLNEEYVCKVGKSKVKVKIRCITENKVFNSIREAATYYNLHDINIQNIIKGHKMKKTDLKFEKLTN